jgi:uncharacterized protein (TIGR03435 family)
VQRQRSGCWRTEHGWSPAAALVSGEADRRVPADDVLHQAYLQYAEARPHAPFFFSTIPVENGPNWISSDRYTINAEAPGGASFEMMMGPMMEALLESRFQLKIRHQTKEGAVYALTVAKGGPKLGDAEDIRCTRRDPNGFGTAAQTRPSLLLCDGHDRGHGRSAVLLQVSVDRPVIDKTGITGTFEFRLNFARDEAIAGVPPEDPTLPSIFSALQEQLGLKLESAKGPVDVLVIDHVERPTED